MSSSDTSDVSDTINEFVFNIDGKEVRETEILNLLNSTKSADRIALNNFIRKAIVYDCNEIFEILFENDYQISVMNTKGQTAVHLAFYDEEYRIRGRQQAQRHLRTVDSYLFDPSVVANLFVNEWLLKYSEKLDCIDSYGLSYLHIACFMGNIELVKKCLTDHNVNNHFSHSESLYANFTPLHFAVINNTDDNVKIINYLLDHGANVSAHDLKGRTPLHLACSLYNEPFDFHDEYDQYIQGGRPLEEIDFDCLSIYSSKSLGILKVLVQHQSDLEFTDKNGNTPLLSIFPKNYYELSRLNEYWYYSGDVPMQETIIKFAYLVKVGADISAKNHQGDTIVHLIVKNIKIWRDYSPEGTGPLSQFDDIDHAKLVEHVFKVKNDFDANLKNQDGETPLQLAVHYLSYDLVKTLVNNKANLTDLKMIWADKDLFEFYDSVPNFYVVKNLMAIIDLFNSKDCDMSPAAHLFILRFLIHNQVDCACSQHMYDLLYFASATHVIHFFTEMYNNSGPIDFETEGIDSYWHFIKRGGFYIDKSLRKLIPEVSQKNDLSYLTKLRSSLKKELKIMKSTKLQNNVSLFDVMAQHPYDIPSYVVANFDFDVADRFTYYDEIVRSHLIKSTVRQYVLKYGSDSVEYLCPLLPEICYNMVLRYLSNTDIANMYSATTVINTNETRLFVCVL